MQQINFSFYEDVDSSPIVVGFCGAKGHGKDTAAEVLTNFYGFVRVSFADGLRKTVCTALRVNESYFTDPARKEEIDHRTGKPRRFWLQSIGTEGFRALWDDVWTTWWSKEITEKGYGRVVTTDVRFPNEVNALRSFQKSILIRVTNPAKPVGDDLHASEAHYMTFDVDYDIVNDGTIEDLQGHVRDIVAARFNIERLRLNAFPLDI